MANKAPLQDLVVKYDDDKGTIKLARYQGEVVNLTVAQGCATVGTSRYYISNNLPDGTILSCNIVRSRNREITPSILVRDVLKYGDSDLSAVPFRSRFEILDLLCMSFQNDYGFKMFGGRCIAPYTYVALPITFSLAYKCQDDNLVGVTLYTGDDVSPIGTDALTIDVDDDSDSVARFPPVPDEGKRVMAYKHMVQANIRKMGGKWKDVYLKKHTPGQLPFSSEDLMSQGLMEVMIAIRKYNSLHLSKAKESTFVFRHLYHRFGHIAHKYSKQSRGYGIMLVRDFVDDTGHLTPSYELAEGN